MAKDCQNSIYFGPISRFNIMEIKYVSNLCNGLTLYKKTLIREKNKLEGKKAEKCFW